MTDTARDVLRVLQQDHRGRENAVKAKHLALRVGITGASRAKRVSDAVAELRRQHGHMIVGCNSGLYIARTEEEKRAYVDALNQRIAGLARTRRAIVHRHPEMDQLALEV